jgi:hypothetical protein
MECALCREREADKKNTHYLTDAIIRGNLNEDGGNERYKGSYWDLSSNKAFPEFGFQQATSQKTLLEVLGREPTQEEIDKAKGTPAFSVDNVFCSQCEKWFGTIENPFIEKTLPCFRGRDLSKIVSYTCKDSYPFRSFFLLQVWRSAICHPSYKLSAGVVDKLREALLTGDVEKMKEFPLLVTYLETPSGSTANFVGYTVSDVQKIILMNDFVVQFFESEQVIAFHGLQGINDEADYKSFVNFREESFKVKVIPEQKSVPLMVKIAGEMAGHKMAIWTRTFAEMWKKYTGSYPTKEFTVQYRTELTDWNHLPKHERMREERISKFTVDFVNKHNPKLRRF